MYRMSIGFTALMKKSLIVFLIAPLLMPTFAQASYANPTSEEKAEVYMVTRSSIYSAPGLVPATPANPGFETQYVSYSTIQQGRQLYYDYLVSYYDAVGGSYGVNEVVNFLDANPGYTFTWSPSSVTGDGAAGPSAAATAPTVNIDTTVADNAAVSASDVTPEQRAEAYLLNNPGVILSDGMVPSTGGSYVRYSNPAEGRALYKEYLVDYAQENPFWYSEEAENLYSVSSATAGTSANERALAYMIDNVLEKETGVITDFGNSIPYSSFEEGNRIRLEILTRHAESSPNWYKDESIARGSITRDAAGDGISDLQARVDAGKFDAATAAAITDSLSAVGTGMAAADIKETLLDSKAKILDMLSSDTISPERATQLNAYLLKLDEILLTLDETLVPTDNLEYPDRPAMPDDQLDITYGNIVDMLDWSIETIDINLTDSDYSESDKNAMRDSRNNMSALRATYSTQPRNWYIDPWGRFGVKSKIQDSEMSFGFMGSHGSVWTNANEEIFFDINRHGALSDLYTGAVALYVNGVRRDGFSQANFTHNNLASAIGGSLANFLLSNEGFKKNPPGGFCSVPVNETFVKNSFIALLDPIRTYKYDGGFTIAGDQENATLTQILDYYGWGWNSPYADPTFQRVETYRSPGSTRLDCSWVNEEECSTVDGEEVCTTSRVRECENVIVRGNTVNRRGWRTWGRAPWGGSYDVRSCNTSCTFAADGDSTCLTDCEVLYYDVPVCEDDRDWEASFG